MAKRGRKKAARAGKRKAAPKRKMAKKTASRRKGARKSARPTRKGARKPSRPRGGTMTASAPRVAEERPMEAEVISDTEEETDRMEFP